MERFVPEFQREAWSRLTVVRLVQQLQREFRRPCHTTEMSPAG